MTLNPSAPPPVLTDVICTSGVFFSSATSLYRAPPEIVPDHLLACGKRELLMFSIVPS